ncbi:MAG: anion transporter [Deltaproteobacteria bacterium]|nr:anion transporter [Deltaproteobacteria bacterium]
MTAAVVVVFVLTYVLIALRRVRLLPIGRPAGALLGATAMVVIGAVTPEESYRAIDGDTILLLLAMMLLTAELAQTGFFAWSAERILAACRTPGRLMVIIGVASAAGSALLVNDTVCLFMTPIVVATCVRARLPLGPYLIVLATSSNLGSAATLVGNPQNMLIGSMSNLPFGTFLLASLPVVAVTFTLHILLALVMYRRALSATPAWGADASAPRAPRPEGLAPVLVVLGGVVVAFFLGAHLGYAAMTGAVVMMVVRFREPRDTFARVDWTVLLFFCGLFVVTHAFAATGIVKDLWNDAAPHLRFDDAGGLAAFTGLMTAGSNVISNVPMVLMTGPYLPELGHPELGFVLLAFVTTVAGNLTLVGSVANIIVAEGARDHHHLGFVEYLKFGAASTLVVLAVGVPLLAWWAPLVLRP